MRAEDFSAWLFPDDRLAIRRSRDVGAYLGLIPRRYQSGEVDYVGGISKGATDRR
jgi:transposase